MEWVAHTQRRPYYGADVPVEVELFDGTREVYRRPSAAKAMSAHVTRWRVIPSVLLVDGV